MMKDENDHSREKRGSSAVGHTLEVVNLVLVNGYKKIVDRVLSFKRPIIPKHQRKK